VRSFYFTQMYHSNYVPESSNMAGTKWSFRMLYSWKNHLYSAMKTHGVNSYVTCTIPATEESYKVRPPVICLV
jgi:hypothetical protein